MLRTIKHWSRYRRRAHRRWAIGALFCLLVSVAMSNADAQGDPAPAFEVASVRLSAPGTVFSQRLTDTRLDLSKFPLRQVLWLAFQPGRKTFESIFTRHSRRVVGRWFLKCCRDSSPRDSDFVFR
jgi:hypothetical protein